MSKWQDMSEVVAGKILKKECDPNAVNPATLFPPYNEIVPLVRDNVPLDNIIMQVSMSAVQAAMNAADTVNGTIPIGSLIASLETAAARAKAGASLRKQADVLERGDEADLGKIVAAASMLESGYLEMTPMVKVDPAAGAWVKTGYAPIDDNMWGIPDASLTVLAASPGVGKTSLMLKIVSAMMKRRENKKRKAAIFTLEMTMSQLTKRMLEVDDTLTDDEKERILLSEEIVGPQEIYAIASRLAAQESLFLIAIDFADQMVEGEQTEAVMGIIYRTLAMLAKRTGVPVLLISQLNRATYTGGIPRINHLRYSGLAEALAALIILVYNPHNIFVDYKDDTTLPKLPGVAYLIQGKSRYGYKQGQPGAAQVNWDGVTGWGDRSLGWFILGG